MASSLPGPLPPHVQRALATLQQRLRERFGDALLDLRLFGSYARGDAHDESDVDVFVELEAADYDERRAVLDITGDLLWQEGVVLSPTVFSREQRAMQSAWEWPLIRTIQREGVPLEGFVE